MIPETNGTVAAFQDEQQNETYRPVIAWDEDGSALIADGESGVLVAAHSQPGFVGLTHIDRPRLLIPGGGYRVKFREGSAWGDLPVAAWAVFGAHTSEDGQAYPLVSTGGGALERADEVDQVAEVYLPESHTP